MRTHSLFLAGTLVVLCGCAQPRIATALLDLPKGTDMASVFSRFGDPVHWGNLGHDPFPGGAYALNTSWQTSGGVHPLKIDRQIDCVYIRKGMNDMDKDAAIILRFDKRKLVDRVSGTLTMIYDP